MSDVFVSYSRVDTAAVRQLHDALIVHGKELWVDWDGIPKGVEFLDEIYRAIEAADVFLVGISPDSAASEICGLELAHALKYCKRLIPVVLRDAPVVDLPHEVAMINWIFLREQDDFESGIQDVVSVIETNPLWVRTHTRLLTQAVQWQTANHDRSLLLRGRELEKVEQQLGDVTDEDSPRPTTLQRQFLAASRANMSRFWRNVLTSVSAALVAVIFLAILAWVQKLKADKNALLAAEQADRYSRSTFSLQLGLVREEIEQRSFDLAGMLLADEVRCPKPLRSFAWGYYLDQSRRERLRMTGHTGAVNCLSLSADGHRIASSSDDRTIRLWDASSLTTTSELIGHEDEIWAVAFSPADPDMLVSGSRDGVVFLWNLNEPESPRQICHRMSEFPAVTAVAFHPNGRSLSVAHRDGFVQLFDTEDWERIGESKLDQRVSDLDWSPDGNTLVAACEDENVHLWNDDLTEHRTFVAHSGGVQALDFLDQPLQLITSGRDGKIRIWQDPAVVANSNMKPTMEVELVANGIVHAFTTSPDGETIIWVSSAGSVHAWGRDTEQFEANFPIEKDDSAQPLDRSIYSVCVLGGGSQLLTAVHDGTIRLWQLEDRSPNIKVAAPDIMTKAVYLNPSANVAGIITRDGDAFWRRLGPRASNDRLHPIESPPLLTPAGHSTDDDVSNPMALLQRPTAFHIAVSDDGSLIAPVFSRVNSLIVYRTEGQAGQFEVNGHEKPIGWAEFSKDSRLLATVDYDGLLLLHETSEGKLVASRNLGQPAYRMAFCPDEDRLCVALANGNIEVLSSTNLSRSLVFSAPVEGQPATDMTFDLARERLVVAMDGSVYCASTESDSSEMSLFIVADQTVARLCCSPDGEILATGHQDGSIRMWDAKTGDLRGLIQGEETAVADMFFHPNGRRLYVIDRVGTVKALQSEKESASR